LIAKKRYAGYASFYKGSDNDHIEIKGLEFMRTDVSAVVRKVQHKIVDMILKGVASEEKIVEIILAVKQAVLAGKMRKEDIEIRKVLTKEPKEYKTSTPHSRVATWANQNGIECFVGTKVPFIVVNREKVDESLLASDKKGLCAMHGDVWKEEYGYDIAYYWNKMVFPSLERVLVAAFPKRKWEEFYYQNGIKKRGKK